MWQKKTRTRRRVPYLMSTWNPTHIQPVTLKTRAPDNNAFSPDPRKTVITSEQCNLLSIGSKRTRSFESPKSRDFAKVDIELNEGKESYPASFNQWQCERLTPIPSSISAVGSHFHLYPPSDVENPPQTTSPILKRIALDNLSPISNASHCDMKVCMKPKYAKVNIRSPIKSRLHLNRVITSSVSSTGNKVADQFECNQLIFSELSPSNRNCLISNCSDIKHAFSQRLFRFSMTNSDLIPTIIVPMLSSHRMSPRDDLMRFLKNVFKLNYVSEIRPRVCNSSSIGSLWDGQLPCNHLPVAVIFFDITQIISLSLPESNSRRHNSQDALLSTSFIHVLLELQESLNLSVVGFIHTKELSIRAIKSLKSSLCEIKNALLENSQGEPKAYDFYHYLALRLKPQLQSNPAIQMNAKMETAQQANDFMTVRSSHSTHQLLKIGTSLNSSWIGSVVM